MHVFLCHAAPDQAAADRLRADLAGLGEQVWMHREQNGGHHWWSTVLRRVRGCSVLLFALSPDSVRSRACLAELSYARALHRPILPVVVRPVDPDLLPPELVGLPRADFSRRTPDTVIGLRKALAALPPARELPHPLPPDPPLPYLDAYRHRLEDLTLDAGAQREILLDLRARLADPEERGAVWGLLARMRSRRDLLPAVAAELEKLLAPAWQPDPERRFDRRYWDGQAWTTLVRHESREFSERRIPPPEANWPTPGDLRAPATPPRRTRRTKPWVLGGAAVAVVAGTVAGVVLLTGGEPTTDPTRVARTFVDSVNLRDTTGLDRVTCQRARDRAGDLFPGGAFRLTLESVQADTDPPTFIVLATDATTGGSDRRTLAMVLEGSDWHVCPTP